MEHFPDKYTETFNTWNNLAEVYDQKFNAIRIYDTTYAFLLNLLPRGARILDLGCGPAIVSGYLKQRRSDLQIYGADVASNMIERARKNVPDGIFSVQDCRNPDYPDASFDAVVAAFLIPYFSSEELETFLGRVYALLGDQGILYLSFVAGSPDESGFKTGSGGMRVYFNYHGLNDLRKQLTNSGFEVKREFHIPYPAPDSEEKHTVLVAQKK